MLAFVAVTAVLGTSKVRGFASLFLGLAIGLIGIDSLTGQLRLTFGIPFLSDGIDVVVVAVAIFAVGEALWVAAHLRRRPADVIPVGRPWMGKSGLEAILETVAARHRVRLPVRSAASRRCGNPDVPLLRHREEADQAPGGVRQGCHRGRCRTGGGQQRLRSRNTGADAGARPAHQRHRRGDAGRIRPVRHPAGAEPVHQSGRSDLDADRQPVHRQPAAADHQFAAGSALGASCCGSRGPTSTRASCSSPPSVRSR